ncbi:Transcriptional regulator containing PAS, AAA-type ATPase, and DNA-binding Fis domains [Thermanaeromonas toyohensis ToBE]|uniref:Transcriptional regulator containing PAS, AAA-type ATPase, and DNA-binding Fis domains n=1 Tax=Thermanaeromonas toyohensis ToBE TaxID=698762 RepID=A0A1W1VHR6_9FIRM|nr:sigma 54-interacting transcriptional regulator [Thermanaeromonas toyohensis]SMB92770.1 Transcriptional regulator containing PAS, AAA-type ATPase, and DNA-binding Fis domains [Thermanaeromonas toyohensis ToBE]
MLASTPENTVYYQAGYSIGSQLPVNGLEEIPAKISALGIGDLKLQSVKDDKITIKWYECLTCSHLPPVGQPLCYLEAGLLAGALNKFLKKKVEVEETKCWGTGERYCQMEATISPVSGLDEPYPFFLPEENNKLLIDLTFQAVQATRNYRQATWGSAKEMEGLPLSIGEAIFHMIPLGLVIADNQGRVVKINKAGTQMLGIAGQRVQGRLLEEILPLARYSEILKSGKPQVWEFQKTKGNTIIAIGTPLGVQAKIEGVLCQLFSAESELVRLLLEQLKKQEAKVSHNPENLKPGWPLVFHFHHIQTLNHQFRNVLTLAQKAAWSNATILILGESGTGKGLLAQAIHEESPRRNAPFIKVNCAAIPPELLESELFGYEEGAFTGAKKGGKPGKLELADGGTIFLDEIGDMPLNMQAKLLRVLQDKEIERLGSTQTRKIDVRVIAATNRDLEKMVQEGRFREDLFYRLNVVKLVLPPLRERPEDIPLLAESILQRLNEEYGKELRLTPAARECLLSYSWPGNVRELENVLERAVILAEDQEIHPHHLAIGYTGKKKGVREISPLYKVRIEAEKEAIIQALEAFGGEKTRAAKALGLSRQALYAKMARYGLLKK